ncbi:MAG: tetratricopeptide repeat protein [Flavobacteriales bacterium]
MSATAKQLEQTLEKLESKSERLKVMLDLVMLYGNDNFLEGCKLANEAIAIAQDLKDDENLAKAYEGFAACAWKLAEYTLSLEYYANGLEIFAKTGDKFGIARCYCGMGIICGSTEQYQTALDYFEAGLENAQADNQVEFSATILGNIGHVYFNFGQYQKAREFFEKALAHYQELNVIEGAANMLGGIAGVHVYMGEYFLGLEMVRKALKLNKQVKSKHGVVISLMNIGITLGKMGRLQEAEASLLEGLEFCKSINLKSNEQPLVAELIKLYGLMGNQEQQQFYNNLYEEGRREEETASVKRKNEQLKQRSELQLLKRNQEIT